MIYLEFLIIYLKAYLLNEDICLDDFGELCLKQTFIEALLNVRSRVCEQVKSPIVYGFM